MDAPSPGATAEIDEEELRRRTEFLKAQRDKLLAMKREEREKQLAEAERQQMKSRPKSARAARSAFGESRKLSKKHWRVQPMVTLLLFQEKEEQGPPGVWIHRHSRSAEP